MENQIKQKIQLDCPRGSKDNKKQNLYIVYREENRSQNELASRIS
jgi:hypothetical protein